MANPPLNQPEQYLFYYPIAIVVMVFCVASFLGIRLKRWLTWCIAALGIVFFLINIYVLNYPTGVDFEIFRQAGVAVRQGLNPYADVWMVSPPTAMPLFALMASLPPNVSLFIWTTLNVAMALALVPLAQQVLQVQAGRGFKPVPMALLALLIVTIALSLPIYWGIGLGQLGSFVSLCLFVALYAQGKNWAILAGIALGFATIKPQTMLPFLLLFLRKADRRTWIAFIGVVCVLCLASGPPGTLLSRLQDELGNIAKLAAAGAGNDYSFESPDFRTIVGIDYALYCLGLRDRAVIRVAQLAILGGLGSILALGIVRKRLPRDAAASLVAIYAFIFLYHRLHDASILIIPLVYACSRALACDRPQRRLFTTAFIALLLVSFIHPKVFEVGVSAISSKLGGIQWLVPLLLPYATWLSLLAMGCLYIASCTVGRDTNDRHNDDRPDHRLPLEV